LFCPEYISIVAPSFPVADNSAVLYRYLSPRLAIGFSTTGMIGGDAVIFKPTANNNEQVLEYNITERDPNFKPYPTQVISQASGHQENGVTTLIFTRPLAPAGKHVSGLSHERCASLCAVWPECALCAHVCTCVRVCILCVHSCACT